jgi:hypothetical protein
MATARAAIVSNPRLRKWLNILQSPVAVVSLDSGDASRRFGDNEAAKACRIENTRSQFRRSNVSLVFAILPRQTSAQSANWE